MNAKIVKTAIAKGFTMAAPPTLDELLIEWFKTQHNIIIKMHPHGTPLEYNPTVRFNDVVFHTEVGFYTDIDTAYNDIFERAFYMLDQVVARHHNTSQVSNISNKVVS